MSLSSQGLGEVIIHKGNRKCLGMLHSIIQLQAMLHTPTVLLTLMIEMRQHHQPSCRHPPVNQVPRTERYPSNVHGAYVQLLSSDACHTHAAMLASSNKQTSDLGAGSLLKELTSGEHALQVSPPATPRVTMVCLE